MKSADASRRFSMLNWWDKALFFYKFLKSPQQIGSIIPSSKALASQMTKPVDWLLAEAIAELGSGTGVVTRQICAKKQAHAAMLLFEKDADMRRKLSRQYPNVTIGDDALQLYSTMQQQGLSQLDAIISGLPFAMFPFAVRESILDIVEQSLKPSGVFVTFQYSLHMRKRLKERFAMEHIQFVLWNFPPAFVYVCRKNR
ncbi:class I SAM-dependent methyltransferase [Paenibacillus apiarius]|uniref:Phospholipid methyltransferase n=1 Tax=Paenibacillus apiarius TaxID=46240 RepID=A0ABT4DSR9_9BACL|nr:phospholipid methyltransferase [Paenibacillus apiarius]MBN3523520.1 phospholipid methyltransferase [Paenibacillus apiarius]MCY9515779.1 phospholipid methyltransferase [Paenibacillus apiarius]MCY9520407.1 phospholipid methyltransferase [Paenibacillus apiarius]MCY9554985.1 phospholipid methyltransferase [Paenibacillus apiarius]MCY9559061.1 phospholipid methyltransferase [Paenibacillus apiarius]